MRRLLCLLLLATLGPSLPAAEMAYVERGKIDFDTAMQLLNPYGTWKRSAGSWAYTPLDHAAPYQHGRWLYTDYGWYWQGTAPHSWMTEHYGFWKKGADGLWAWYPGPDWLPQIVELRATATHIGWRCAAVDAEGSFIEDPSERYAKPEEWSFVTNAQFVRPISPANLASTAMAARLLDDSTSCLHTYATYRAIERPGPHPADFVALGGSLGMFPPALEGAAPLNSSKPWGSESGAKGSVVLADGSSVSPADARQVRYWTTMSLPDYWTRAPADARPNEIYIYRPEIYQDQEGIERRVRLWLHPKEKPLENGDLNTVLGKSAAPAPATSSDATRPRSADPFRNPFDESYHGDSSHPAASPAASNAAPSGLSAPPANH
jgi:hypothetical protein